MKKIPILLTIWLSLAIMTLATFFLDIERYPLLFAIVFVTAWTIINHLARPQPDGIASIERLEKRRLYYRNGILWMIVIQIVFSTCQLDLTAWYIETAFLGLLIVFGNSLMSLWHASKHFVWGMTIGFPLATLIAYPLLLIMVGLLASGGQTIEGLDFTPALLALLCTGLAVTIRLAEKTPITTSNGK